MMAGTMPNCASNSSRRGEAEANTRSGRSADTATTRFCKDTSGGLLESECDATLGQVIGCHLDIDPVSRQDTDPVLAHLPGGVGQNLMLVVELHAKHGVR